MKLAYVDCSSGISGDMFMAALLDAGLPLDYLKGQYAQVHLPDDFDVRCTEVHKGAMRATSFEVFDPLGAEEKAAHGPHLSEPEHEHVHEHAHDHAHEHEHSHEHEHVHTPAGMAEGGAHEPDAEARAHNAHSHEEHYHPGHRNLKDIQALIEGSHLSSKVQGMALAIFQKVAEAEAHVHGQPVDQVHFHEVGALDSILDIIGAAVGLDYFGVERLYAAALPMGSGQVMTQHGLLPLPAPATLEILSRAGAPVVPSPAKVELVTPTGAAILAALATFEQPSMLLSRVGSGAGKRDLPWPNILRLVLGDPLPEGHATPMVQIETNIDDMNPQIFGHVMGRLFAAGALDVYFTPIYMKKNRPATMLSVIAKRADEPALAKMILEETSTLGMRVQPIARYEAERAFTQVMTPYGQVTLKLKKMDGKLIQASPEYETCVRLAEEQKVPVQQVISAALAASGELVQ